MYPYTYAPPHQSWELSARITRDKVPFFDKHCFQWTFLPLQRPKSRYGQGFLHFCAKKPEVIFNRMFMGKAVFAGRSRLKTPVFGVFARLRQGAHERPVWPLSCRKSCKKFTLFGLYPHPCPKIKWTKKCQKKRCRNGSLSRLAHFSRGLLAQWNVHWGFFSIKRARSTVGRNVHCASEFFAYFFYFYLFFQKKTKNDFYTRDMLKNTRGQKMGKFSLHGRRRDAFFWVFLPKRFRGRSAPKNVLLDISWARKHFFFKHLVDLQ